MDLGNERVFGYARPELYSDSESSQEKMVEGIAESETGNNQIVLWRGAEAEAEEEENQPLPPVRMFFEPIQYHNAIKLGTRCYIHKAVTKLESLDLEPHELLWFTEHPQFKHLWHMHRAMHEDTTHKMMGMWLLLLRTVVNSVPIRYSLREHAILGGLNYLPYPEDYESIGSSSFKNRYFQGTVHSLASVEKKLKSMRGLVNLDRYSFDVNMKEIEHTMRHFNGVVGTDAWTFPSFVTPLELLAFEAIPCLKNKYREDVRGAGRDCPRMCRQKFQPFTLKGFPLSELYKTLGNTRVIESILQPSEYEVIMLAGVIERNEEEDIGDIVPENWTRHLVEEKKPIFWKEICKIDVDARDNKGTEKVAPLGFVEQLQSLQKSMDAQFLRISARMDGFDTRLCSVEQYVKETRREREGPGDVGGEVFRNDVEHEHDQAREKLESLVKTEKARKQKQPKQKPKKKQKEPEQKEPEQKEAEQKEAEQKEAEQKEAEKKEVEQKEAEQKEPVQNEPEMNEAELKEAEQLVARSPYLLRSKEVEPDGANVVNAEVGAGKRKQEQSKLGPNTRQRR
ncbi:uncharacterized protein At3g43530-like [Eutrema salsugineum]|uniref:uncharacterized protein At3g43530-like n=1 Tax=Eutrema salsugineum TaxID=72664 RepID=UPI000CED4A6E|nr:uncharacterized protein At3g43530-like [Eutrema salsugineum]